MISVSVRLTNKIKDVVNIHGLSVSRMTMRELLQIAEECIASREQLFVSVVNVAKVINARKDHQLRQSLEQADLIVADGLPLIWLSQMLGDPLPERIAGIDIMGELLKEANRKHYRVYFLGAKANVLNKVIETIQREFPGIRIAGYRDGYFDKDQEQGIAEEISRSGADILFVAISSPKKEIFLRKWRSFIKVPICHGVGGSFDVFAGVTKRAPLWMQKCGLEWLYRLVQEPRRMWKRYLITNTIFIKLSIVAIVKTRLGKLVRRIKFTPATGAKDQVE